MSAGNPKSETVETASMRTSKEIESLESILRKLPPDEQKEVFRILYGDTPDVIPISAEVQAYADERDFEVAAHKFAPSA